MMMSMKQSKIIPPDPYVTVPPAGFSRSSHSSQPSRDSYRATAAASRGRGTMRDMVMCPDEEDRGGKRMAHVGEAKGDYVQVSRFRYVGKGGGGQFNLQSAELEDPPQCTSWHCLGMLFVILVILPVIAWIMWPEQADIGSLLQQTNALVTTDGIVHTGPAAVDAPASAKAGISFTLRVENVDYAGLEANPKAFKAFEIAVRQALVFYVGRGITAERIEVTLRRSFKTVRADVVPPCGTDLLQLQSSLNFTHLAKAVTANLHTVGGWRSRLGSTLKASVVNCRTFAASCEAPPHAAHHSEVRGSSGGNALDGVTTSEPNSGKSAAQVPVEAAGHALRHDGLDRFGHPAKQDRKQHRKAVVVSGAVGASARQVNGVYLQQGYLNEKMSFQKDNEADVWLAFVRQRWYVTDAQRKEDNTGGGWLYSVDVDSPDPVDVKAWQEWDGKSWVSKASIKVVWRTEEEKDTQQGETDYSEEEQAIIRQMTIVNNGTTPWKVAAKHSGCLNWEQIKVGTDFVVKSSQQCGVRCKLTPGCVGFNYYDSGPCAGMGPETGPDAPGTCSLWNGTCASERNRCWTNYIMVG